MIITQTVPMCPECSVMMSSRVSKGRWFFFCHDCLKILEVIGTGKAEIELIVTDREVKDECERVS